MINIVVTGGKGFLGQAVTASNNLGNVIPLNSSMYDLRSYEQTEKMYQDLKPNIVVHLAATVGGIGANKNNPGLYRRKFDHGI